MSFGRVTIDGPYIPAVAASAICHRSESKGVGDDRSRLGRKTSGLSLAQDLFAWE